MSHLPRFWPLLAASGLAAPPVRGFESDAEGVAFFEKEIRPLF